jgi:ELWxxDGT repeat protein
LFEFSASFIMHLRILLIISLLMVAAGGKLLLGANSTLGVRQIADLNPGSAGSFPGDFQVFSGSLFFSAYTLNTGRELWKLAGNEVVLAAMINDTTRLVGDGIQAGNDSNPEWLTEFDGQLYFSAYDPRRGGELWRFDGLEANRVADISPDANDSIKPFPNSSWPSELTVFDRALYFSANSGAIRDNYELWRFDGATASQAANIRPDSGANHSSYPKELTVFGDALYFMADDGSNGFELWKFSKGQTSLLNINPGGPNSSSFPKHFTPFGNHLYFQAYHSQHGYELWRTDGETVSMAVDLKVGSGSSFPEYLTTFNGALYFRATDGIHGFELFKHDGVQTILAAEINPFGDSYPKNLTVFGNLLVFAADDGVHGWELWKYDGENAAMIRDLNPEGDSFPEQLLVVNDLLYFVATTPETGYELWRYDGVEVTLAADVNPGPGSSYPQFLTSYNGRLYFSAADDGESNWELWGLFEEEEPPFENPAIVLTSESSGTVLAAPGRVVLNAAVTDPGGSVTHLEFFHNSTSVGVASTSPYELIVGDLAAGVYSFTAVAMSSHGPQGNSNMLKIEVADQPSITSMVEEAGVIVIEVNGTDGIAHTLETTSDLVIWTSVESRTLVDGTATFIEPAFGEKRFYRVVAR